MPAAAVATAPRRGGIRVLAGEAAAVDEAVLFAFDDVAIPFTRNLRLSMRQPRKHDANPVLPRGPAGSADEFGVQFYGSIVRDAGRFKLWYIAIDAEFGNPAAWVRSLRPAYAESADGIRWTRPELGLVEHRGSRKNNLVAVEPAPLRMINLKVLVEPDDPDPGRRYKMTAHTWWSDEGREGKGTLAPLVSADGLRWRLVLDRRPVAGYLAARDMFLPRHHFEAAGGLYRWNGVYYAAGQSSPEGPSRVHSGRHGTGSYSGRELLLHRSPDFLHWSETAHVGFVRDAQRRAFRFGAGEETHEGVSVWHRGNVLVGLYGLWHGGPEWRDRTLDLGFLISNDGVRFREPARDWPFLEHGPDGAWDQGGLLQGQGFENVGDRTYVWYGAWDLRVGLRFLPRGGLGLAVLDRDRFGALALREPGTGAFVTAPLQADGPARLWMNVDGIAPEARVRVELRDEQDRPLPGFSGTSAGTVRQSGFRSPVEWGRETMIRGPRRPFRVAVALEGERADTLRFYALYVGS
jgi:hypothetical protein